MRLAAPLLLVGVSRFFFNCLFLSSADFVLERLLARGALRRRREKEALSRRKATARKVGAKSGREKWARKAGAKGGREKRARKVGAALGIFSAKGRAGP